MNSHVHIHLEGRDLKRGDLLLHLTNHEVYQIVSFNRESGEVCLNHVGGVHGFTYKATDVTPAYWRFLGAGGVHLERLEAATRATYGKGARRRAELSRIQQRVHTLRLERDEARRKLADALNEHVDRARLPTPRTRISPPEPYNYRMGEYNAGPNTDVFQINQALRVVGLSHAVHYVQLVGDDLILGIMPDAWPEVRERLERTRHEWDRCDDRLVASRIQRGPFAVRAAE